MPPESLFPSPTFSCYLVGHKQQQLDPAEHMEHDTLKSMDRNQELLIIWNFACALARPSHVRFGKEHSFPSSLLFSSEKEDIKTQIFACQDHDAVERESDPTP